MRDDATPTHPQPIDVLAAQIESFRKHPDDEDLYAELHEALRDKGQPDAVAEVAELRAPHERDPLKAAAIWSEAGEARLLVGDDRRGERDLREAIALDPGNERANARLAERLMVARRYAEAAEVMESELAELDRRAAAAPQRGDHEPFSARRGQRHRMLAELWDAELGRIDRALEHWQAAWRLEPDRSEAIEAARTIYRSLGRDDMVAKLYRAEIEAIGDNASSKHRGALHLELGRILGRRGEHEAAASELERATALMPESFEAREALAEVYASPEFAGTDEQKARASALFVELGRSRLGTEEHDSAIGYLRRALGVDPYSRAGTENLEEALSLDERWDELERLYRHQESLAAEDELLVATLRKRAALYDGRIDDRDSLKECLAAIAAREPAFSQAGMRLRELYREDQEWNALAALMERDLEALGDDAPRLAVELLELATIAREHLNDRDRAAEHLHRALSVDPDNEEALARYSDHFRERRDWRGLADLTEFAIESARAAGSPTAHIVRQLEELAQLAELRLGDVDRAVEAWRRVQNIEGDNPKAREALRRLASRAKMWEQLVGVLEQEAAAAEGPQQRAEALRRMAQVYRERQVNPRRAIELYEEVLTVFPDDAASIKALAELYEREGDDEGLASSMRRQLDIDAAVVAQKAAADGRDRPGPRDWPVAQRVERLTTLRRLAAMYEQRVNDIEGVVFACGGILEILPGDRDALERMERTLDKAGDKQRLEQTLEYHAESATGPAERAKVLRRLARLAGDRNDDLAAMERWERVLKAARNDQQALSELAALYERHSRWADLAEVLERLLAGKSTPPPGTPEAAARSLDIRRLAQVTDQQLERPDKAVRAWTQLLDLLPYDREALDALARLHEARGDWRDLASIYERQAPLHLVDDPAKAADVALARAQLLEGRLGAPLEAARALETLIADVDPANLPAHKALRRLYEARGDFEAAVRIAEREMYLTDEDGERIARGLEIGYLCRDQLGQSTRALQAFERVLGIEGDHDEALSAAAELYAQVGDWARHVSLLERRVERAAAGDERRALMMRVASATADKLGDPPKAFLWYRAAHDHAPDANTIAELRRAAEAHGLWAELADVYEDERARLVDGDASASGPPVVRGDAAAFVSACRQLATIAERRLDDKARAMNVLREALVVSPRDKDLVAEVERIALEGDDESLWQQLVDCLDVSLPTADRDGKVALHSRRAQVFEERLGDAKSAVEELLRAFSWAPERDETRQGLYALAERTRRWGDVVGVEQALFERAPTLERAVQILRRKAQIIEENLHQRARAFRAHLQAFLLAPEDNETVAHLWRLAKEIDSYKASDKTAAPEPPAAHVESDGALGGNARPSAQRPLTIESSKPRREDTEELSASDLMADEPGPNGPGQRPRESTIELDISDLAEARAARNDPTIELRVEDLLTALRPPPPPTGRGAPPPPPRRPSMPGVAPMSARQAPPRPGPARLALVSMVSRSYASPWEEFAAAYEQLPARDTATRLRWTFRAAEVWESGAKDLDRAFETLERALELAPDDAEPRARLYRLAAEHDKWDSLANLYLEAADNANNPDSAAQLLMDVAAIRVEQDKLRETEAIYRRVLGMQPEHEVARDKLQALYRNEKRWVDLAALLEERTDPRLGSAAPEAERPALLRELAAIYKDELSRPHDALDALARLRDLAPEDLDILEQIADINRGMGRWSQVIDTLYRVADIAEGKPQAREALRAIGEIYETEVELPDRAIDAYRTLVEVSADDVGGYEALDRLYREHARWEDLSDTLRRRAALTEDPADRARLLQRRARVLIEWLDRPDEAASALRHARTIAPDDNSLAEDLVEALILSGREREASSVLEGRIQALEGEQSAPAGDTAALLIRLGSLRAEQLGDKDGARAAFDRALELVPDHPTALAAIARVAGEDDPRGYAEAKLREANALDDIEAKIKALLDAGTALRDGCQDADGARAAFERVLELAPGHREATWALAGLVESSGDLEEAQRLLESQLERDDTDEDDQARIHTQLAAIARAAGIDAAALRRFDAALSVAPTHLPAIMGKADLLGDLNRHTELEVFLQNTIPELADAAPDTRAELDRRLALAYEALGRDDDAYQTLLEADRLHRKNLLVKLALGENRYRARRWREAALHLGALGDYPDAPSRAGEVADGLYHAALAEIRSLRPDKAEPLYRKALELKPNHGQALHALAELAMERGQMQEAADLLTRQATSSEDPAERVRLFEALGDLALMALKDEERARACFVSAVNAAEPLESKHIPLLEKLLERQDLAKDHAGAARTAELMASFGESAQARAARFAAAARNYLTAGDTDRATAAAVKAVETNPDDLASATVVSDLLLEAEQYERVADILGRALSGKEAQTDVEAAQYALLWQRLGTARRARGDTKGAVVAFEKAIASSHDSDGAHAGRRALVELWQDDSDKRDRALEYCRTVAAADRKAADILRLGRLLRRDTGAGPVNTDGGRVTLELASALGENLDPADVEFITRYPDRPMADDDNYKAVISEVDRVRLIADADDEPLASALAVLWEAAPLLWSEPDEALARAGIEGAQRVPSKTTQPAAVMFPHLAKALAIPATLLYRTDDPNAADVQVVCVSPPLVVLGPRLAEDAAEPPSDLELRFALTRACELARPRRIIAAGLPEGDFAGLLGSLQRVFGSGGDAADEGQREHDQMLRKTLPVKVRRELGELLADASPRELDAARFIAACQRSADRAGLLLTGDAATAIRLVGGTDRSAHLVRLALDEHYLDARARLGIGLG